MEDFTKYYSCTTSSKYMHQVDYQTQLTYIF